MRARNIKPGFYENEDLAECSPFARLLFPGLWLMADREGRLEDRTKRIKASIFPYDDIDIEALLGELAKHGFIERYEVEGKGYIQVLNFLKHQNPHRQEKASEIPPMPESGASLTNTNHIQHKDRTTSEVIQDKYCTSLEQAQDKNSTNSEAVGLIPDSLIPDSLIPDSLNLIPDSGFSENAPTEKDPPKRSASKQPLDGMPYDKEAFAVIYEQGSFLDHLPNYLPDAPSEIRLLRELGQEYPNVNLVAEFRRARDWLINAPASKKPKGDLKKFLRNWVSNAVVKYGAGQRRIIGYETETVFVPAESGGEQHGGHAATG